MLGYRAAVRLPPMDVAGRLPRLCALLGAKGCDALLVTSLTNVRYLTGFTGSAAMLLVLVGAERALLVTDGRYETQAAEQLAAAGVDAEIAVGNAARQAEVLAAATGAVGRLGLEAGSVTWREQLDWADKLMPDLVAVDGLVEALREVKDAGEVARIERAASIADEALGAMLPMLAGAPTEREVALELDFTMRRLGAGGPSFDTIVAAGPRAAMPHARPSDRPIGAGELVVLDFGAEVDGYRSDTTRTVCVGEPSDPDAAAIVEAVAEAEAAGVAAVRAGAGARDVDTACREVLAGHGLADRFVHGTGHGVGLDIHEAPILGATATATLDAGFVVTVEPGVYLPGRLGVRIEDSVLVTSDGCRPLTTFPKDLVIT